MRFPLITAAGNLLANADNPSTLGQLATLGLPKGTYYADVQSFGQYLPRAFV